MEETRGKRQESPIGNWPSLQFLDSWPKLVDAFVKRGREWHVAGPPCPDKNLRNVHPVPVPVPPTLTSPLFGILQQLSWPMPTGPAPLPVSLPQFFGPGIGLVDGLVAYRRTKLFFPSGDLSDDGLVAPITSWNFWSRWPLMSGHVGETWNTVRNPFDNFVLQLSYATQQQDGELFPPEVRSLSLPILGTSMLCAEQP